MLHQLAPHPQTPVRAIDANVKHVSAVFANLQEGAAYDAAAVRCLVPLSRQKKIQRQSQIASPTKERVAEQPCKLFVCSRHVFVGHPRYFTQVAQGNAPDLDRRLFHQPILSRRAGCYETPIISFDVSGASISAVSASEKVHLNRFFLRLSGEDAELQIGW
jgi:hypothetical protein